MLDGSGIEKKIWQYFTDCKAMELFQSGKSFFIKFLSGSLKSFFISYIKNFEPNRKFVVIVSEPDTLNKYYLDLNFFFPKDKVFAISTTVSKSVLQNYRQKKDLGIIENLVSFQSSNDGILIVTPEVFDYTFPSKETFEEKRLIQVGESIQYQDFIEEMLLKGFARKDFVEEQGDIAIRGGIVDIFPLASEHPIRIEFFGDEVESIRYFDIETQKSLQKLEKIEFITGLFDNSSNGSKLTDYLTRDEIFIVDQIDTITKDYPNFTLIGENQTIFINPLANAEINVNSTLMPKNYSSIKNCIKEIIELSSLGYQLCFSSDGVLLSERLQDILRNGLEIAFHENVENPPLLNKSPDELIASARWFEKPLSEGFRIDDIGIVFYTEHQIFGRVRTQASVRSYKGKGISFRELTELKKGDYVVHVDKGIARFEGLERIKIGESYQDCVKLIFADDDILYVNLNYIHKIQRYRAEEGVVPKLSKLGTSEWQRKKQRVKERLKNQARDLIKLYAQRKMSKGFAFPEDTVWQKEFEASFVYEDTIDQSKATDEVKRDMESEAPMDRLICGDVGFGKTEVAIRAAFKCIQAGKQAAVLVPTTILASQHELTFKERLKSYPVIIESISRFKPSSKIKQILEDLANGKIDIIIGTHRLLSDDVKFKDLGLLIIDEEHRFGVAAKEKLRKLRVNVDTLTMTATPIPRTLNFSLLGVRDLSIMETPPRNRLPIYTEVIFWDDKSIQKAILNELARDGQVFFVVDQISRIDKALARLTRLVPNARIGIAHGQMNSVELEKVMQDFISGNTDILLTTKIIEAGLDIPRANTIFIYNAQNFGLAELYQLRGRVGRTNIQAFCYLIIPPVETLSTKALQRLMALEEFTDLGSGLKLAMRDLEIRGAGDIFGVEQSGFINEIGYEMYERILQEAINEIKTEEFPELFAHEEKTPSFLNNEELQIEVDFDAFIPSFYISNEMERYKYYKEFYHASKPEDAEKLRKELTDKFGKIPPEVENLFKVISLRQKAINTGIQKIKIKGNHLTLEFPSKENQAFYDEMLEIILDFASTIEKSKFVERKDHLELIIPISSFSNVIEILWRFKRTLEVIHK